jgi:thiosulfate reductase cytochrome b subunit
LAPRVRNQPQAPLFAEIIAMASVPSETFRQPVAVRGVVVRHSAVVRVCHWVNALCFLMLLMSGLQIFNARPALSWGQTTQFKSPFLGFSARENEDGAVTGVTTLFGRSFDTTGFLGASRGPDGDWEERGFPSWATLPAEQDLAMGRRWHFFFAWLLVLNGLVYVVNLFAARHWRDLVPTRADLKAIPRTVVDHARLRFPKGDAALRYNVLQKLAYLSVVVAFAVLVLAGLTMSPAMDAVFPWLVPLFHGRQSARTIHFFLAASLVAFVAVHLVMVLVSGVFNNMRSMITGRYRVPEETK